MLFRKILGEKEFLQAKGFYKPIVTFMISKSQVILKDQQMKRIVEKLANDIYESHKKTKKLVLIGILSKGEVLANRIKVLLNQKSDLVVDVYQLDITIFRDDLDIKGPSLEFTQCKPLPNINGCHVILIDDVLFEGRTMRGALSSLLDVGRAKKIQTAVLVDRGHRAMPIVANYLGIYLETRIQDFVRVRCLEIDGEDKIVLESLD